MAYKITHPRKRPNGATKFGAYEVEFSNGTATLREVPDVLAARLAQDGFKVAVAPDEKPTKAAAKEK